MEITPITRRIVDLPVSATERDGSDAAIQSVDVALIPDRQSPTRDTAWTATVYEGGIATFLIAGPDADPDGALVVPKSGAHLWFRVMDNPEVDAERVEKITVL